MTASGSTTISGNTPANGQVCPSGQRWTGSVTERSNFAQVLVCSTSAGCSAGQGTAGSSSGCSTCPRGKYGLGGTSSWCVVLCRVRTRICNKETNSPSPSSSYLYTAPVAMQGQPARPLERHLPPRAQPAQPVNIRSLALQFGRSQMGARSRLMTLLHALTRRLWSRPNHENSCSPGGYYTGSTTCGVCPAGRYSLSGAVSMCTRCESGKASNTNGASSFSTCVACTAGSYASSSGSSTCATCTAGKYSTGSASSCTNCECYVGQKEKIARGQLRGEERCCCVRGRGLIFTRVQ